MHSARLPQWPTDLTLSPDGTRLFLVNLGSTRLLEVDLSGEQTRAVEIGTGSSAGAHPDGKRLYVANQSLGFVQEVDLDSGQVGDLIPVGRAPMSLSLTPDGRGIYVANAGSASVSLWTWSSARCGRRSSSGATRLPAPVPAPHLSPTRARRPSRGLALALAQCKQHAGISALALWTREC